MAEVVPIVFCFDERFGGYATVAIASALSHADAYYKVYCLYSGEPAKFPGALLELANRYRCEIIRVDIPPDLFSDWRTSGAYSKAVYYRLLIPDVVAEPRAIYLDCDVIVTCGLAELFNHDLGGGWLGGCPDPTSTALKLIDLPPDDPYLNSGVLLLDLDALRRHLPLATIQNIYISNIEKILWPDQCLINKMAEGKKAILPSRWNYQLHVVPRENMPEELMRFDGSGVVHFSGPIKPWMEWSSTKAADLWWRYARLTGVEPSELRIVASDAPQKTYLATKHEAEGDWKAAAEVWKQVAFALIDYLKSTSSEAVAA